MQTPRRGSAGARGAGVPGPINRHRRRRSPDDSSPDGESALPVDYRAEAELITRALVADPDSPARAPALKAIRTAPPDLLWHPTYSTLAELIRGLLERGEDPTRERVIDAGVERRGNVEEWRAAVRVLDLELLPDPHFRLVISDAAWESALEHLERLRRQRIIMAKAAELSESARTSTDWHEAIEELAEVGRYNGAVTSASTLEIVDFDAIIRGDAPDVEAFWLRRRDDLPLLYPGRIHDLHAEPSVGKTWIALEAVRQVFAGGGNALYLDFEDSAQAVYGRLSALGVDSALLAKDAGRWRYINPVGALDALELTELANVCAELVPDLVVIDGVAESLARDGYDENSNPEVLAWAERLPRPLARTGAAVLMLDHVKRDEATRSRGARGAGAKLGLIDGVSYNVRLAQPFSRRRAGLVKLIIAKDRPGQVGAIGETAAEVRIEPYHDGAVIEVNLETPAPADEAFRPTGLMQALSERLESSEKPLTGEVLLKAVRRGKRALREEALALLVAEGFVDELESEVGASRYSSTRRFREVDDLDRRRTASGLTMTAPSTAAPPPPPPAELFDSSSDDFWQDPDPKGPS